MEEGKEGEGCAESSSMRGDSSPSHPLWRSWVTKSKKIEILHVRERTKQCLKAVVDIWIGTACHDWKKVPQKNKYRRACKPLLGYPFINKKREMTLDHGCKSQSRVTSVHSWYLTSFVILSFYCLPFASSWRSQTQFSISLARIPSVFFFHSWSKGEISWLLSSGLYASLRVFTHSNLNTLWLVAYLTSIILRNTAVFVGWFLHYGYTDLMVLFFLTHGSDCYYSFFSRALL